MQCEKCSHKKVCAFKEGYGELADKLKTIEVPSIFKVNLECSHFGVEYNFYKSLSQMQTQYQCGNGTGVSPCNFGKSSY